LLALTIAAYSTWAERKVAALCKTELDPNKAGPFGLLQPLLMVESFSLKKILHRPMQKNFFYIRTFISHVYFIDYRSSYSLGKSLNIGGTSFDLQVANIDVGVLYIIGMASIGVYGIMIGGWASNNKYSLIGAIRASSQMISYELAMGLALLSIIMMTGSLDLKVITESQAGKTLGIIN
jgi:NADH-quinone oxidoreductase subunit H